MYKGCVGDMGELGITESLSVKRQVIIRQVQYCNDSSKFVNLAERHIWPQRFECTYVVLRIFKPATVINVK